MLEKSNIKTMDIAKELKVEQEPWFSSVTATARAS
jgi:hypothetical protein